MIIRNLIRFCVNFIALSLSAHSSNGASLSNQVPAQTSGSPVEIPAPDSVLRINSFGCDLFAQLRTNQGNFFFSPYGISSCLAMVYSGARGDTAAQMARVLHFDASPDNAACAFGALLRRLTPQTNQIELNVANGLWSQAGHSFLPAFLNLCFHQLRATLNQVDFRTESESARTQINDWVAQQTNGKIKDLIQSGILNQSSRLALVNAIYFKGVWSSPFEKRNTASQPFFLSSDQKVTVPMMTQLGEFNYAEIEGAQLLELPYGSDNLTRARREPFRRLLSEPQFLDRASFSMVVILPREIGSLKKVEDALSTSALDGWLAQAHEQKVRVFLPSFKMSSEFNLGQSLGALGMTQPFTREANFSGMDGARDLFLSTVIHKAFVDVDEQGTEAAGATVGIIAKHAVISRPIPVFRADHAFIFLIRERQSGTALFIGRVANPTQ